MIRVLVGEWWRWWRLRREARAYVRRNGLPAVCSAMWVLNRRAPASAWQQAIYPLKDLLLRELCRTLPYRVELERWVWPCSHCEPDGSCDECGGTGVWLFRELWRFEFVVGGRRYVWHAPRSRVDWPLTRWDGGWRRLDPPDLAAAPAMTREQELTLVAVVWEGLRLLGVSGRELGRRGRVVGLRRVSDLARVVLWQVARWRQCRWPRGGAGRCPTCGSRLTYRPERGASGCELCAAVQWFFLRAGEP